ncbi:lysophospholipid acyltransferase family protein [Mycoplasma sp. 888]|uniref:lysophospholipid acyltransferase family protein n=1 Tax=Mycoplasma sp. 888 TaxID=3108483 RepID=UPI002D7754DE|nr:lysophospholipid acyltransferase family protein [Mycoplasma sp. 888]WRQ25975.1 lysophospholipid acyltransferase family protein [Mycoplasma sp. 888]
MKKYNVNVIFKMILFSPVWLLRYFLIKWKARKYRKSPETSKLIERYAFLLKHSKKMLNLYNVDVKIEGYENLPQNGSVLLVANHKSNFDSLILMKATEQQSYEQGAKAMIPTFLAKSELQKKKIVKDTLSLLDTVFIDRKSIKNSLNALGDFGAFVKVQKTYGVIFPEGTRVKSEGLGEFKAGAFRVAQKDYMSIVPTVIINSLGSDSVHKKQRQQVTVKFLPALKPSTFMNQETSKLAERVKSLIESELLKEKDEN